MSARKLKFLVDVGVGEKVEEYLLEKRYDTKAVRSLDQSMPDQEIIRLAALEKRIVITMDKDFGELVYHSGLDHCGILLLRLEDATGSEKQQVIAKILAKYADNIKNNFCVYQNKKFRFRKLSRAK
jgi:predicted nuclease of predicted toxin-antitoxin system